MSSVLSLLRRLSIALALSFFAVYGARADSALDPTSPAEAAAWSMQANDPYSLKSPDPSSKQFYEFAVQQHRKNADTGASSLTLELYGTSEPLLVQWTDGDHKIMGLQNSDGSWSLGHHVSFVPTDDPEKVYGSVAITLFDENDAPVTSRTVDTFFIPNTSSPAYLSSDTRDWVINNRIVGTTYTMNLVGEPKIQSTDFFYDHGLVLQIWRNRAGDRFAAVTEESGQRVAAAVIDDSVPLINWSEGSDPEHFTLQLKTGPASMTARTLPLPPS